MKSFREKEIGLLGGGQLGRMLLQEAVNLDLRIHILDPSADAPCKNYCTSFQQGDFRDYDTVYRFGQGKDLITIEFEDVNVEALFALEKEGIEVYPQPRVLQLIQDKGLQKKFYRDNGFPTAPFALVENAAELAKCPIPPPFYQKLRKGGYDGYGVKKIRTEADLMQAFDLPSVAEQQADLWKELSVIVSRNNRGEISHFPVVDMEFNPESNMVQFLFSPADISPEIEEKAIGIARGIIEKLEMTGLLAVELFLNKNGEIWVNEIAPRPHNSGHHTIEAHICSQYEQHLRAILTLPPGSTKAIMPAVMINLLGEKGYTGTPVYGGLEDVLSWKGCFVHLYGKTQTKPFRKMGHVTVMHPDLQIAKEQAQKILKTVRIISNA